jgi:hypothetical protein
VFRKRWIGINLCSLHSIVNSKSASLFFQRTVEAKPKPLIFSLGALMVVSSVCSSDTRNVDCPASVLNDQL